MQCLLMFTKRYLSGENDFQNVYFRNTTQTIIMLFLLFINLGLYS